MFGTPIVAYQVVTIVSFVILVVSFVVELIAFVHCATRRSEAFPVVGRLSKGTWTLMTGAAFLFTLFGAAISGVFRGVLSGGFSYVSGGFLTTILAFIALGISMVYLLDIRPAIRDVLDNRGGW